MSAKNYWFAFGLGVAAGAAFALLYAPASGARTRKRLGRSINEGVESLEDAAEYLRDQAEVLSKQAQKAIELARGQVDEAVDSVSGAVTGAVKNVRAFM